MAINERNQKTCQDDRWLAQRRYPATVHRERLNPMEMLVEINGQGSVDPVRLEESVILLREELLTLGVEDVRSVRGGMIPGGARAVDLATIGALLVVVNESADLIVRVVTAVRSWLRRGPQGQEVELIVGDRTLRLSDATPEQQDRLIEEFVRAISKG